MVIEELESQSIPWVTVFHGLRGLLFYLFMKSLAVDLIKMSYIRLDMLILSASLVAMFGILWESLGGMTSLGDVHHCRQALRIYSFSPILNASLLSLKG